MNTLAPAIPIIDSLKDVGSGYRAWLVDIWGVMHNGRHAYANASAATQAYREQGGIVVLLSNSPRPSAGVQEQLRHFGVPDDAYDGTVTSGDLTRHELGKHPKARVFHLGPERDLPIFDGLDVTLVDAADAEIIVCSGPFDDDVETPEDYVESLRDMAGRGLPMICANPDLMVERGARLVYCAGALAAVYEQHGGNVVYAGKPHEPVYELAFEKIAALAGKATPKTDVLAIGDGVHTDIEGAGRVGVDAVYVASALHAPGESGAEMDEPHLAELFSGAPRLPIAATHALRW